MSAASTPPSLSALFLAIREPKSLASFLQLPLSRLTYLLYGPAKTRTYKKFNIAKRNGKEREILAPIRPLKFAQRRIATALYEIHRPRSCAFGYVPARSILDNARRHSGNRWLLRVDLENFFPSVNFGRIRGVFLAVPFSFPSRIATMLAQITTYNGQLPQGAPTSPILSNFIAHRLDYKLINLAQRHNCYFTRYADDLTFSANQRTFPKDLGALDTSGISMKAIVGDDLKRIIESEGFRVNASKVQLRQRSSRQLCTGLVVNKRPNVRREFVREVRALLHIWKKFDLSNAGQHFFAQMDKRNRPFAPMSEHFKHVVRGKVQFIGWVKGWSDPTYFRLASRLVALDATFAPKTIMPALTKGKIRIYAEGKTDYSHLEAALDHFHSAGQYLDLRLDLSPAPINGGDTLLKHCRTLSIHGSAELVVFMFDRDVPKVIAEVTEKGEPFRNWGNRIYTLAIPIPKHRASETRVCIEMYYLDEDLSLSDEHGRRLFLRQEFNEKGFHSSGRFVMENPKRQALVVDGDVNDVDTQAGVGLSKASFADCVKAKSPPFNNIKFKAFSEIFSVLRAIVVADSKQ